MKTKNQILGASLLAGALAITPQLALAAPPPPNNFTPACTQISNTANVSFAVGGITQTPANSNTTQFYVGVKVNVAVVTTDGNNVTVYPGSTASALTYTVTNNGNAHQKYVLSYIPEADLTASPFTGSDNYDGTNAIIKIAGVAATTIADLAPDASKTVTINVDTPLTQSDADVAVYALKAQTQWVGSSTDVTTDGTVTGTTIGGTTCNAAGSNNIDVVVADTAGTDDIAKDGASSARSAYQVTAANLTIVKSSSVIYDPVHCTSYSPLTCTGIAKGIPGAVVEYTIQVSNGATGTATGVTVKDTLDSNLTFLNDGYATGKGIQVTAPNLYSGSATALTNAGDADQGDWNSSNAGAVTVNGIQVTNGQSAYVKFRATIK